MGCLLINFQTANAESAVATGGFTLPAQSLSQPIISGQQEEASDALTDSTKKLLSGLSKQLTIDNSTGTIPVDSAAEERQVVSNTKTSSEKAAIADAGNSLPAPKRLTHHPGR
ncbi:hypothetical protein [Aliamphritea spongicola]|nr:hypothetical protein [Aliamphritea spongicola]